MSHHYWEPKQLCLTEVQVMQHKETECRLLTLNHVAAQLLIEISHLYHHLNSCIRLLRAVLGVSYSINLLMMGCEQIVEGALRQRPQSVTFHIHCNRSIDTAAEAEESRIDLAPNRVLQLQLSALLPLLSGTMGLLDADISSASGSMPMIKALTRLMRAILREQSHFQNIGATATTLSVVVHDEEPSRAEG